MSEENVPVVNQTPDVEETPETLQAKVEEVAEKVADKVEEAEAEVVAVEKTAEEVVEEAADEAPVDLGSLSLAELSDMFDKLSQDENRMRRYKEPRLSSRLSTRGFPRKRQMPVLVPRLMSLLHVKT